MVSQVYVQRIDDTPAPKFFHEGDAAVDLQARKSMIIEPGKSSLIPTGIKLALPAKHVGLIWDRSGIASKNSMHVLAGVIDSNYRGEIKIVIANLGEESFHIKKGMRIAQMLIQPILQPTFVEVESLTDTERGEDGFGSTGT